MYSKKYTHHMSMHIYVSLMLHLCIHVQCLEHERCRSTNDVQNMKDAQVQMYKLLQCLDQKRCTSTNNAQNMKPKYTTYIFYRPQLQMMSYSY